MFKIRSAPHIDIDLDMTELDVTKAETKATYEEIKAYVLEHTGLKVSYLYVAQVKAKHGIIERDCYNKAKEVHSAVFQHALDEGVFRHEGRCGFPEETPVLGSVIVIGFGKECRET